MRLTNNYKITSLVLFVSLFLGCMLATIYCYSYMINNIVKNRFVNSAVATNNYYYDQIVSINLNGYDVINNKDYHQWNSEASYLKLMLDSIRFFIGSEAINLNLRNARGKVILSLDQYQITSDPIDNVPGASHIFYYLDKAGSIFFPDQFTNTSFEKSLLGFTQSTIIPNATFRNSEGYLTKGVIAKVIMPIIDKSGSNRDNPVLGVVEYYFDMSFGWSKSQRVAMIMFTILGLLLFITILHLRSVYDKFHNVVGMMVKLNDKLLSAKEEANDELQRKTIFLSTISHEMKTPISAIAGYSEDMLMEQTGSINNPIYKQYIEDINSISKYTLSLVKDILDYARATTNQLSMEYSCFDVRKILISCARMVELRAKQFGLKLHLDLSADSLPILANQKRFKQCILNILTNSIKYTPSGGNIRIYADIDRSMKYDQVKITFEDTGIGIDPKDLAKSLENFEKINEVKSTKYEGTGLGLPFTRKLIELMGGKFDIESDFGKGTKISFTFKYQDHI